MSLSLWQQCLARLQDELPATEFSMWIRPLQAELSDNTLALYAPNRFVLDWVRDKYLNNINGLLNDFCGTDAPLLRFEVGSKPITQVISQTVTASVSSAPAAPAARTAAPSRPSWDNAAAQPELSYRSNVNPKHTFDNFVEGKSNQLARAAARQVADNPGGAYNPLFLYGGTGLGKTHLLHAVGNGIMARKANAKVVYMHSERFVQDMVKALQNNAIEEFKRYYRSVDALLIDDIQFFANKERSQEEFFHTFNALLEGNQQIILTSDRYPKEINGVEDRLKSRFGWGLTVAIEPPELETRVAILMKKADENDIRLPGEVAFFIAKRLRSNVRELEGALNRVIANANFTGRVSPSISCAKRCAICWRCRKSWSPSTISKRRWRSITRLKSRICCPSGVRDPLPARARWRWRWRRNSPTTACRKSAMRLVAATIPRCCTPAGRSSSCVRKVTTSKKISPI